jgi:hypothetical protein
MAKPDEETYEDWFQCVDGLCVDRLSINARGLDWSWASSFADFLSPSEAFNAMYADIYGGNWAEENSQFGVGA